MAFTRISYAGDAGAGFPPKPVCGHDLSPGADVGAFFVRGAR